MNEFKHPFVVCRHRIKIKNLEQLAKELALKLNLKVTAEFEDRFKITYEAPTSKGLARIMERKSRLIPQLKYELHLNDFKIIIYEDFFEIVFKFEIDFFHILGLHQKKQLKEVSFFKEIFNLLSLICISEIYIGIFEEFGKDKKIKYTWKNVFRELSKTSQTFIVQL
jgi:hypothetical protein